jgi:hypothetical protein
MKFNFRKILLSSFGALLAYDYSTKEDIFIRNVITI